MVRAWTAVDGLPLGTIQSLTQTPDRYLWIGTDEGLIRFDGSSFLAFNPQNPPLIPRKSVFTLLAVRDGSLWIGTEGVGVYRLSNGIVEAFTEQQGLTNGFIRCIVQGAEGAIWIGTDDGVFRQKGSRFERIDNTADLPAITVHAIFQAKDGAIWIGGSRLVRWIHSRAEEWPWSRNSAQTSIKSMMQTADGTFYFGCADGLYKISPPAIAARKAPEKIARLNDTVRSLHQASDGTIWVATSRHGLFLYQGGNLIPAPVSRSQVGNTVLSICEDSDRNLWIGTQTGLARLHETEIATIPLSAAKFSDFGTIYGDPADPKGVLWFAYSGLYQYSQGKLTQIRFPKLDTEAVHTVFHERSGAIWLGTNGQGVYRIDKTGTRHYTIENGLVNNFVRALVESPDGNVWIATDGGLSRWSENQNRAPDLANVLINTTARDVLAEPNGDLWVAMRKGIVHFHRGVVQNDPLTRRLNDEIVSTLCRDSEGELWFGTVNSGIFRLKNNRIDQFTRLDGLPANRIEKILEDSSQRIWFSTVNGISSVDRSSFDRVANHLERNLSVNVYSVEDELQSARIYGGYPSTGLVASDGAVWFAGIEGPIRMPATSPTPGRPAPVTIDEVVANGRRVETDLPIRLNPDASRVEFHYTAILPQAPERIRYRYRLVGFDRDWTEPSTEKLAAYSNLPAGRYEFQVVAYDLNSPDRVSSAKIGFEQVPHFYRTSWFLSLCVLAIAGIVVAGHAIYVQQIRAKYQGILQERARFARELHDTLIQGCTTATALLEASATAQGPASETLVHHACEQIRSTTETARRVVWNLRNDEKAHQVFSQAVESLVGKFRKDFQLPVECEISGKPSDISEECEHELMTVLREALYNAARHSRATDVRVIIRYQNGGLSIELRDNGVGFDVERVTARQSDHYGLKGIQERIARIKGNVKLQSSAAEGTRIAISLPSKSLSRK